MDTSRLKALPLFEGVSDEDLDKIAPFVSEVSVSEGKHLVDEGDYAYEFMAIEEGEAEVVRGDETLATLSAGDYFGEIGLLEDDRRNATVIARSPMRLLTLDQWDMKRLEKAIPSAAEKIRETVRSRRQ
ncbi:MAG TPA: cyclic nucleotide-binding domain-containing protein [Thermoleophilaceae bacterium]|nr:cyclic nucleotide-binding domain-containing protein [Thermoleophilaceae bacterium]HYI37869.1 cyclic nucleotide-binding domain-containing protein [Thermoleophilaceae bacterium]